MRKLLAAAALTASIATGLAMAAPAQAATATTASAGNWGKYYSSNGYAYNHGKTYKHNGKVYTKWYGNDRHSGGKGYVWFGYYKNGSWHKFYEDFSGKDSGQWSSSGIKKIYTYTCWGGKHQHCGNKHFIY